MLTGTTILARNLSRSELAGLSVIASIESGDVLFRDHDVELVLDRDRGLVSLLVPERDAAGHRVMRPSRSYHV